MDKHTPEPWEQQGCFIWRDGHRVAEALSMDTDLAFTNAARIVTCVNACEGMADPAAEIAKLKADAAWVMDKACENIAQDNTIATLRKALAELVIKTDLAFAALATDDWSLDWERRMMDAIAAAKAVLNG